MVRDADIVCRETGIHYTLIVVRKEFVNREIMGLTARRLVDERLEAIEEMKVGKELRL